MVEQQNLTGPFQTSESMSSTSRFPGLLVCPNFLHSGTTPCAGKADFYTDEQAHSVSSFNILNSSHNYQHTIYRNK